MLHAAARIAELGAGTLSVICPAELYTAEDCAEWIDQQVAPARIKPRIEAAPPGLRYWRRVLLNSAADCWRSTRPHPRAAG